MHPPTNVIRGSLTPAAAIGFVKSAKVIAAGSIGTSCDIFPISNFHISKKNRTTQSVSNFSITIVSARPAFVHSAKAGNSIIASM